MVEALVTPFPLQAPRESGNSHFLNSEFLTGIKAKEALAKTVAVGLIMIGLAVILDGSINQNNLETFTGGLVFGLGVYNLLKRSS